MDRGVSRLLCLKAKALSTVFCIMGLLVKTKNAIVMDRIFVISPFKVDYFFFFFTGVGTGAGLLKSFILILRKNNMSP